MNIREKLRGAWRRMGGQVSAKDEAQVRAGEEKRRTVALPSIFNTYGPRTDALPKPTAANLRKFAETPVARKAINTIKDRVAGMRWRVQMKAGRNADPSTSLRAAREDKRNARSLDSREDHALARDDKRNTRSLDSREDHVFARDGKRYTRSLDSRDNHALARDDNSNADPSTSLRAARDDKRNTRSLDSRDNHALARHDNSLGLSVDERLRILTATFEAPNPDDSFRSFTEQVLEDVIVGGFGAAELQLAGEASHPLVMWPVDGATIRIRADWDGSPDAPRYVQATGRYGPEGRIALNDDELMYIRLNPRTHTPFGLGRLEVAFETINEFLGAHRYAARLASNSVVQYALWLKDLTPAHHERLIRWWQDEIEGTGRVPILSVESKPEVLRFGTGNDSDLRLAWQEFLLRVIADAFDLPPLFLGLEHDVNRATAAELSDTAFRSAIVPTARLLAEHLTRDVIAKKLGWDDLEFVFTDVESRNELEQAQIEEILLRNGVVSVEEVRMMRGLPVRNKDAGLSGS